jgi:hypothetical protein
VVELVAAIAVAPWAQPLQFRPLPGWQRGANGTFNSSYGPVKGIAAPKESTAWMANGVRFRDRRTADPPDATLSRLPRRGIVVFAVIYQATKTAQKRIAGAGPGLAYSVIVRVYFGSPPTRTMRAGAQLALDRLALPTSR